MDHVCRCDFGGIERAVVELPDVDWHGRDYVGMFGCRCGKKADRPVPAVGIRVSISFELNSKRALFVRGQMTNR